MADLPTVEVITTVRIGTTTKTFTATANTTGDPCRAARQLLLAVDGDVSEWTYDYARETR